MFSLLQNTAVYDGGGIKLQQNSNPIITSATIVGNHAEKGGAIFARSGSTPHIFNSIIWDNTDNQLYFLNNNDEGEYYIDYSLVQGGEDSALVTEGNGTTVLHWGNGNIDADPMFCSSNSSLSFDGVDDYVNIGDPDLLDFDYNEPFSVEVWVNISQAPSPFYQIISKLNSSLQGWGFQIFSDMKLGAYLSNDWGNNYIYTETTQSLSADNTWHHVMLTYNGSSDASGVNIYVDGSAMDVSVASNSLSATITNDGNLWIGAYDPGYEYFKGQMDEVAIWNNALAAAEITELYNSGFGLSASANSGNYTSSSNLLAYWDFNEGSGSTVVDQTSNGNDGTVYGATWMNSDYTLAENSPCVGSGQGGANMGAYGVGCSAILAVEEEFIPVQFAIHQNYPNPFNPVTTIRYELPENGLVNIIIYDILGRRVKTLISQTQTAGHRSVQWNATNDYGKPVSAGVYLYQIHAGKHISTKKMVLLK